MTDQQRKWLAILIGAAIIGAPLWYVLIRQSDPDCCRFDAAQAYEDSN